MPAGAKPGERRGGRAKGTPNKSSIERRLMVLNATGENYSERLGRLTLSKVAFELEVLAEKYNPDTSETPNEELYVKYLIAAAKVAGDLTPYQSPKLASIYTNQSKQSALERVGSVEKEEYATLMMEIAEKGELPRQAQAYLSKPKSGGNGSGGNGGGVANR